MDTKTNGHGQSKIKVRTRCVPFKCFTDIRYNKKYPHLAYEPRKVFGAKTSFPMSIHLDIFSSM